MHVNFIELLPASVRNLRQCGIFQLMNFFNRSTKHYVRLTVFDWRIRVAHACVALYGFSRSGYHPFHRAGSSNLTFFERRRPGSLKCSKPKKLSGLLVHMQKLSFINFIAGDTYHYICSLGLFERRWKASLYVAFPIHPYLREGHMVSRNCQ